MSKYYKNWRYDRIIWGFFLLFLLVKIIISLRSHIIFWDEAVYIAMGKYIYSFGDIGLWEPIRPIGLPLIIGLFWKIKWNYIYFSEVMMILVSMLTLLSTYIIGKKAFNHKIGIIASIIMLCTGVYFSYSSLIMTDIISVLFVLIALYFCIERKYFLGGVFSSIAIYFRFQHVLFFISILVFFLIQIISENKKKSTFISTVLLISGFIIGVAPYFLFNYLLYMDHDGFFYRVFYPWINAFSHQFNPAESINGFFINLSYYMLEMIFENFLLLFFIVGIIIIIKNKEIKEPSVKILSITLAIYFIYYTIVPNKQPRFLIAFLPFVSIFAAYAIEIIVFKIRGIKRRIITSIIITLIFVLFILNNLKELNDRDVMPDITMEYNYFFSNFDNPIILTSDPVPAAYVDQRFIPYYESVSSAYNTMSKGNINESWIIFTKEAFFCDKDDKTCIDMLEEIKLILDTKFKKVFDKDYEYKHALIFSPK